MMTRPALAAGLLAANLVLLSLFDHFQSGFTTLIAVAMLGCCVWLSAIALRTGHGAWLLLFLPVALLWNPVVPVQLRAGDWFTVCAVAVLGLVCAAFGIRPSSSSPAATPAV